jgi:hypothetical protein
MTCTLTASFNSKQVDVLYVGFRPLILNHLNLIHTGRSPDAHPDLLTAKYFRRRGVRNDAFMQEILDLWKKLQFGRSKRLRAALDYVTVSATMLAVRSTLRQIRHGHVAAWRGGVQATANRLLRQFEALRKRLKRQTTKREGQNAFRSLASSWRQFLIWLRLNLLTCPCLIRRPDPVYRMRQLMITEMVRVTTAELNAQQCLLPPAPLLRKLVRDALKNVRRFRTPWTIPLLRRNPAIAGWWFAEYVLRRMAH